MSAPRIVVAFSSTRAAAAMSTAVDFARGLRADLLGLFVEDAELLTLATLPFAEIGFPSPLRRSLSVVAMERSMRAQARLAHEALRARLAGGAVKWSFEVVRGRLPAAVCAVATRNDIVVASMPALPAELGATDAFGTLPAPLVLVAEDRHDGERIAVVPAPAVSCTEIARVVEALAGRYGTSALFLLLGAPAQWEDWRAAMRGQLAAAGVAARFRALPAATRGDVDRALAGDKAGIVVALGPDASTQQRLCEALSCPLLLLRVPGTIASAAGDHRLAAP